MNEWDLDAQLLKAWRNATHALEQICERYLDSVITYVRVREPDDLGDLVQSTMEALIRGLPNIRHSGLIRAYALSIANRQVRRFRDQRVLTPEPEYEIIAAPGPVGSSLAAHRQDHRIFIRALHRLPPDDQHLSAWVRRIRHELEDELELGEGSDEPLERQP